MVFAPESGTARVDFPGGDARKLYRSIRTLFALPADTRLFLCHDYPPAGREAHAQSSLDEQKQRNVHAGRGAAEASLVQMRTGRESRLGATKHDQPALEVEHRTDTRP